MLYTWRWLRGVEDFVQLNSLETHVFGTLGITGFLFITICVKIFVCVPDIEKK